MAGEAPGGSRWPGLTGAIKAPGAVRARLGPDRELTCHGGRPDPLNDGFHCAACVGGARLQLPTTDGAAAGGCRPLAGAARSASSAAASGPLLRGRLVKKHTPAATVQVCALKNYNLHINTYKMYCHTVNVTQPTVYNIIIISTHLNRLQNLYAI